jgi:SAM-dependent methyltransferase
MTGPLRSAIHLAGAGLICLVYLVTAAAQRAPAGGAGDPAAGKALFAAGGGCLSCHAVDHRGSRVGPDLSWIGMLRSPESLRRSLTSPAAQAHERYASTLTATEIDHLVAYLRTLRSIAPSEPRERTRSIAPVSDNVAFFNRPERDAEERTDDLVKALEIRDGARLADIGAGTGYFTWRLARAAGPKGRVLAVDIQQAMLDLAAQAVQQHGLLNVDYVLATPRDPKLPQGSLDMVFIAYSYHEFADPETIMEAVRRSLKPGGRLVVVEYAKENNLAPAAPLHKMSFDELRTEIEPMGFELDRILDFLPMQHGLIFTVR